MNVFARMALHRAARRYARLLPGELQADYGASGAYTAGQIAATLDRRQGPGRYVAVAYAGFLTESDYQAIAPSLPVVLPYNLARDLFQRARPFGDRFSSLRALETTSAPENPDA